MACSVEVERRIRVELKDEIAIRKDPATVLVYDGEQLVAEVVAKVELDRGADGGWYYVVKLEKKTGG